MTDPVVRLRGQVVQRPKEQVGHPGGIVDWDFLVQRPKEQVGLACCVLLVFVMEHK